MRARRIAFRCCLAAWFVTFAAWSMSAFVNAMLVTSSFAEQLCGGVVILNTMSQFFGPQRGWAVEVQPSDLYWRVAFTKTSAGSDIMLPLWPLVVVLTIAAFAFLRQVRCGRVLPGHCRCGYSLTGNQSGVCPECGANITVRTAMDSPINPPAHVVYWDRAIFAFENYKKSEYPPEVRRHLVAFAVHACQSLIESLRHAVTEYLASDAGIMAEIAKIPHQTLMENTRNTDIHGAPIPLCAPGLLSVSMFSKPSNPIGFEVKNHASIAITMDSALPEIHRSPKTISNAKVKLGPVVPFVCNDGTLIVGDLSAGKQRVLGAVIADFLKGCRAVIDAITAHPEAHKLPGMPPKNEVPLVDPSKQQPQE